ncbi:MAG: ParB/RepB/Spo0J family partition protein [Candidatus Neomarinimicrobiota bacterium]|jgi:ParB family chromosome partitioning protein
MAKNKVLGRGLDALIPTYPASESSEQIISVNEIDIHKIKPNPYQPRREFKQEELDELAASISKNGLITPITVTLQNDEYILVAGERRTRACKQLGLDTIPAYFRDVESDEELMELALIENVQRENLNPIEEAMAYRALIERYGLSQEIVAERIGKKRSTISNSIRLLKLPQEIRDSLIASEISSGHARAILAVGDTQEMLKTWRQVLAKGLSVRDTEKISRKEKPDTNKQDKEKTQKDPVIFKLESSLQQNLGTKVRVKHRSPGGSIEIVYYSTEDLQRILEIIESGADENR